MENIDKFIKNHSWLSLSIIHVTIFDHYLALITHGLGFADMIHDWLGLNNDLDDFFADNIMFLSSHGDTPSEALLKLDRKLSIIEKNKLYEKVDYSDVLNELYKSFKKNENYFYSEAKSDSINYPSLALALKVRHELPINIANELYENN